MTPIGLLLILGLSAPAPGDSSPSDRVQRLGSSRFEEREAASRELLSLGRPSLAELTTARRSTDPEISLRADYLLEEIERDLVTRPFEFETGTGPLTAAAIVRRVSKEAGTPIEVEPRDDLSWLDRSLPRDPASPISLWSTLDTLDLQPLWIVDRESPVFGLRRPPTFQVGPRAPARQAYFTHKGPLACEILEIQTQTERARIARPAPGLTPRPPVPAPSSLQITLLLLSEPGKSLHAPRLFECIEAVDSTGASLRVEDASVTESGLDPQFGTESAGPTATLRLVLQAPSSEASSLRTLRIRVSADIEARRFAPQEIDRLDSGTLGDFRTPFDCPDGTIRRARIVNRTDGHGLALELAIQPSGLNPVVWNRRGGRRRIDMMAAQLERVLNNVSIADADGNPFRFATHRAVGFEPPDFRVTIGIEPPQPDSNPHSLRIFGTIREPITADFEFHDVPIARAP